MQFRKIPEWLVTMIKTVAQRILSTGKGIKVQYPLGYCTPPPRDNLAGFSLGGGVQYHNWMFDYALTISGGVGYLNTFSLSSFL